MTRTVISLWIVFGEGRGDVKFLAGRSSGDDTGMNGCELSVVRTGYFYWGLGHGLVTGIDALLRVPGLLD